MSSQITTEVKPQRLTPLQTRFIEAYLGEARYSATEAAKLAGFKAKTRAVLANRASDFMRLPVVAARLREHFEASTRSAEADLAELDRLAHSPDSRWETPILDKEGNVKGHRFEARDKVRALELKLKARGMLSENLVIRNIPNDPAELEAALLSHMERLNDVVEGEVVEAKQLEAGESPGRGESAVKADPAKSSGSND